MHDKKTSHSLHMITSEKKRIILFRETSVIASLYTVQRKNNKNKLNQLQNYIFYSA